MGLCLWPSHFLFLMLPPCQGSPCSLPQYRSKACGQRAARPDSRYAICISGGQNHFDIGETDSFETAPDMSTKDDDSES